MSDLGCAVGNLERSGGRGEGREEEDEKGLGVRWGSGLADFRVTLRTCGDGECADSSLSDSGGGSWVGEGPTKRFTAWKLKASVC